MRNTGFGIIVTAAIVFSFNARADEDWRTCDYEGSYSELSACAYDNFEAADADLNITYQAVRQSLNKIQWIALRNQQRIWLGRLRPLCEREATSEVGEGRLWSFIFYSCLTRLTEERTEALKIWPYSELP